MEFVYRVVRTLPMILTLGMCLTAEAHFRGWEFGTEFDRITRDESADYERITLTSAIFSDTLFGFNTRVIYQFSPDNDGLISGTYELNCTGFDIEEVLDHYMKVKAVLDKRYGCGMKSGVIWLNEDSQYRNDLTNAFRFAEVSFKNEWFGPGVIVTAVLKNELNSQGKLVYTIDYKPGREFIPKRDENKL